MSGKSRTPKRKNSKFMKGGPLRAQEAAGEDIHTVASEALKDCTCVPIFHFHDTGHGEGLAILHDPGCQRLIALKAGRN